MIPEFELAVFVDLALIDYQPLPPSAGRDGLGLQREYIDLRSLDAHAAAGLLADEIRYLDELSDQAPSADQFETLIGDFEYDQDGLLPVDLGVQGIVATLSAAGFVTIDSCRGHWGRGFREQPQVAFLADRRRVEHLAQLAASRGCGLSASDADRRVVLLWARTIAHLLDVARDVLDRLDELASVPGLNLAQPRAEVDGEWEGDDD